MIKSLGVKKAIILLLLAVFLAVIYFYGIRSLGPQSISLERELRQAQSSFNETTQKITDLRSDIEKFQLQKDKFINLEVLGFFDAQDRLAITQRLNEMQKQSGLLSAQYSINPAIQEENVKAAEAGYKVLLTKITFDLKALLDQEIYDYIYMLNYGFPGHVVINSLNISKTKEVTPVFLQAVGTDQASSIIDAQLDIDLRTLVPNTNILQSSELEGGFE